MKKAAYLTVGLFAAASLASCDGTKDYDAYVEKLNAQEAAVEKITTRAEYAAYVERFVAMTDSFERLDVKLNPTQADEIKKIDMRITERMNSKYAELTAGSAMPDTIQVGSTPVDTVPAN